MLAKHVASFSPDDRSDDRGRVERSRGIVNTIVSTVSFPNKIPLSRLIRVDYILYYIILYTINFILNILILEIFVLM